MARDEGVDKAIDPARPGLGKGIAWATGSFGCERESYYSETVRDAQNRRLRFPMPERVHFGTAIDVLHATLMRRLRDTNEVGDIATAVDIAYNAGKFGEWDEDPDLDTFRLQIDNAARLLVGEVRHERHGDVPPIYWLPVDGLKVQGMDGESLEVPGAFGGRSLVATPDYLWVNDEGDIERWLDVKATDKAFSYPTKWLGAEAAIYTLACTLHNGGVVPRRIGYMEYRRNAKPYWAITWTDEPIVLAKLAERYIVRWSKALTMGDPDLVSFSPTRCGTCAFARPISEVGFDGCPIGSLLPTISEGATDE